MTSTEIIAMTTRFDKRSITTPLTARAAEVAMEFLGEPNCQLSSKRELRRKGSLAVLTNGTKAGSWYDHEHGVGGDLIDLIDHGVTFREVVTYAKRFIGLLPTLETSSAGHLRAPGLPQLAEPWTTSQPGSILSNKLTSSRTRRTKRQRGARRKLPRCASPGGDRSRRVPLGKPLGPLAADEGDDGLN